MLLIGHYQILQGLIPHSDTTNIKHMGEGNSLYFSYGAVSGCCVWGCVYLAEISQLN